MNIFDNDTRRRGKKKRLRLSASRIKNKWSKGRVRYLDGTRIRYLTRDELLKMENVKKTSPYLREHIDCGSSSSTPESCNISIAARVRLYTIVRQQLNRHWHVHHTSHRDGVAAIALASHRVRSPGDAIPALGNHAWTMLLWKRDAVIQIHDIQTEISSNMCSMKKQEWQGEKMLVNLMGDSAALRVVAFQSKKLYTVDEVRMPGKVPIICEVLYEMFTVSPLGVNRDLQTSVMISNYEAEDLSEKASKNEKDHANKASNSETEARADKLSSNEVQGLTGKTSSYEDKAYKNKQTRHLSIKKITLKKKKPNYTAEAKTLEGDRIVQIKYILRKMVELRNHNPAFGC
ncbi:hypothetical protein PR048_007593 [Dryococelus australis]|uniref:Uncharacterized protein n=1 Tax=Dryococelus australis TaxID=614101 RepID=A0ABQ9HUN9_9NEOP|nr:hypothetical protein PR048_007593 [Dryococelus australis]